MEWDFQKAFDKHTSDKLIYLKAYDRLTFYKVHFYYRTIIHGELVEYKDWHISSTW